MPNDDHPHHDDHAHHDDHDHDHGHDNHFSPMEARVRALETILTDAGLRLVTYDGAPFTPEIPASPVNAEDVGPGAVVGTTIEPTITAGGSVLIAGKILLGDQGGQTA